MMYEDESLRLPPSSADIATEVVLTHELFPDAELAGKHKEGWTSCLNRLEGLFAG